MKKTFKLTLYVKGATKEFSEGMGVGVLATNEVTFKLLKQSDHVFLVDGLRMQARDLIDDCVGVRWEEVKDDQT